jgi:CRP/FNR family transcriptional regulator, anaerobic regulatory protein
MDKLLQTFISLGVEEQEASALCGYFKAVEYKRNEFLLLPGNTAHKLFFVNSGSLLLGYMTDKKTAARHLAMPSEFITCLESFQNKIKTDEFIKATVDSEVFEITRSGFEKAMQEHPIVQSFYQKLVFDILVRCQQRITNLISMDAKTYYDELHQSNPELIQNMHQYDLASYMGIEPQSLSRLRNARSKK